MAIDIILEGTLKAKTPISIKRKGQEDLQGVPQIFMLFAGGAKETPFIPGETFKGLLRSVSADIVTRVIGEQGLHEYFLLHKGGIKADGKEPAPDVVNIGKFRRSNPLIGLYGAAAPEWLGGSISVGPGLPGSLDDVKVAVSDGSRRDDFRLDPERLLLLDPESRALYGRYVQGVRDKGAVATEIKKLTGELKKAKSSADPAENAKIKDIQSAIDTLKSEEAALKDGAEVGNTVGRPLENKYAIAPGSTFNQRIEIFRGEDAEVGLLLATLEELSQTCRIGGMRSIGYGHFEGSWNIKVRDGADRAYSSAGTISIKPQSFELNSDHPAITRALDAWKAREAAPESISVKDYAAKMDRI